MLCKRVQVLRPRRSTSGGQGRGSEDGDEDKGEEAEEEGCDERDD